MDTKSNKKLDMKSDKKSDKNSNLKPGPDDVTARVLKELADDIAAPLTWLFNQSLSNGNKIFPISWKAKLIPVHKSGPKNIASNYRGIALLSIQLGAGEMCLRICNHVDPVYPLLNPLQQGFRPNRSCVSRLIQHVNIISWLHRGIMVVK